jgi:excisionase family DNA binding protein
MTAREVADYLRVSRQRVHMLGQQGHLTVNRQGTLVYYRVESVTAYAQSHGGAAIRLPDEESTTQG